ncbi:hypothetical protein [Prosthecomicrobium sp. N25]|uniref:hypothetical protein n=1 Tax=Prosthecomicrobium sp. N25 TaxID=3129254 RepID=UPI003076D427
MTATFRPRDRSLEAICLYAIFAATLSIFLDLSLKSGVRIRPFDPLVLVSGAILLVAARAGLRVSTGLLLYAIYAGVNALSAFKGGTGNGLRETIQSMEIVLYAAIIASYLDQIDWRKAGTLFLAGLVAIMIYNILWHVSHGFYSGWKMLNEPKFTFTYIQVALFIYLYIRNRSLSLLEAVLLGVLFVILVQSGERKALLLFVAYTGLMVLFGRISFLLVVAALPAVLLVGSILASSDEYVGRQFNSIKAYLTTDRETMSIDEFVVTGDEQTLSNAQRLFAKRLSEEIYEDKYWLGVGTNGYLDYVTDRFSDLPPYLLVGIHNEFQRARTEGGMVGYVVFLVPWLRVLAFIALRLFSRNPNERDQAHVALLAILGLFVHARFEGSGLHSQVNIVFAFLLPELAARVRVQHPGLQIAGPLRPVLRGRPAPGGNAG